MTGYDYRIDLNEHEIDAIVEAAAQAGATIANAIVLRLPHELSQLFPEWHPLPPAVQPPGGRQIPSF